jgi:hypothetical protein
MVSFMSAIQMDLDSGLGAFASINAQLDYRPNPVTELALQLLRAAKEGGPQPKTPAFDPAAVVQSPQSYAGTYTAADGRHLAVVAGADRIYLALGEKRIPLLQSQDGNFIADHPEFNLYPLVFERDPQDAEERAGAARPFEARPIAALAYGPDWYASSSERRARALSPAPLLARYAGKYYSESPWRGTVRVVQRQRQLWIGGTEPLTPIGDHLFRVGPQNTGPETAEFFEFIDDIPRILCFDGGEFQRVEDLDS